MLATTLRGGGPAAYSLLHHAGFAKAAEQTAVAASVKKDWSAVVLPKSADPPTTSGSGQAFANDLRSTSGLGLGDGCKTHTDKWLQVRSPVCQLCERVIAPHVMPEPGALFCRGTRHRLCSTSLLRSPSK
jgi:hypothetical protein